VASARAMHPIIYEAVLLVCTRFLGYSMSCRFCLFGVLCILGILFVR